MLYLRTVKTSSGATAIQVVRYDKRKRIIVKHIGSAHNLEAITSLRQTGRNWIEQETAQQQLFPQEMRPSFTPIEKCVYLDTRYSFIYEILSRLLHLFEFDRINNQLLMDLVIMRIIQPVSKRESLEYLSQMFGIVYKRGKLYQAIASFPAFKNVIEEKTVAFAKQNLSFDFSIVFYDVTTLYYESFTEDADTVDEQGEVIEKGLRKYGFGKEIKHGQPIIVIGLIVTKEGFPVSYDVFEGDIGEGKTFIHAIKKFKDTYSVDTLTIVADAAMISFDNVEKLKEHELSYIVGGRMANLKNEEIKQVHEELIGKSQTAEELQKIDGRSMKIKTERGLLVCAFSMKRYLKGKREMDKQIAKAEKKLQKNEGIKRTKFIKTKGKKKTAQILNTELITKTKLLLGIKGYYTNLFEKDEKLTNQDIINHYHNLWHVEKAFRIAKSDLAMRPIYHFKRQTIEAHILICFMALVICKYMELKSQKSTRKIIKLLKSITEARMKNLLTGKIFIMRKEVSEEINQLLKTILP